MRTLDESKRAAILTAAKQIILRDGYNAAKIADVAAEAGIAAGTIYLYFKSKEELITAIFEDFFVRLGDQADRILEEFESADGVVSLISWALQIAANEKDLLSIAGAARGTAVAGRSAIVKKFSKRLKVLMEGGVIRPYPDSDALAETVMSMLRHLVLAYSSCDALFVNELKSTAIKVLQHALFDDVTLAAERLVKSRVI